MTEEVAVFGVDVSRMDGERLAFSFIRKEWLDIERALSHGKWFDYRFMSPAAATYLFAHEYKKAFSRYFRRNIDSARGEHVTVLAADMFRPVKITKAYHAKIAYVWRARQVADAMGMPYDVFLDRAFHWTTRYWRQSWLPGPQHIISDLATDRTEIDWNEYQSDKLYYAKHENYKNANYDESIKALADHHEWLFAQSARRHDAPFVLAHMLDEDLIPGEKIKSRVGLEKYQRALEVTKKQPSQISL